MDPQGRRCRKSPAALAHGDHPQKSSAPILQCPPQKDGQQDTSSLGIAKQPSHLWLICAHVSISV